MRKLKVDAIRNGTVIDHIPSGKGLSVLQLLQPQSHDVVTLGINLGSQRYGRKDILKIEGRELTPAEVNRIALLAPHAKVNIIRDFKVVEKRPVTLPPVLEGVLQCPNPQCITRTEPATTRFYVSGGEQPSLRCHYCERLFPPEDFHRYILYPGQ